MLGDDVENICKVTFSTSSPMEFLHHDDVENQRSRKPAADDQGDVPLFRSRIWILFCRRTSLDSKASAPDIRHDVGNSWA